MVVVVQNVNENTVRQFLEQFWTLTKVFNVTVMSIMATIVKFYTLQPYKYFIMEELTIENLFPHKIPKNFNGSTLYAISLPLSPFVFRPNELNITDGVEVRIVNEISKYLNFHIEYKNVPPGEHGWFSKRVNNRVTGAFGLLDRLEVDILFHGASIRLDRYLIADIIAIHTIDQVFWIAPKYPHSFDWKSPFIVFRLNLWVLILISLILTSFVVYYLTKPGCISFTGIDAFFQVLAQMLFTPISYHHNSYLYRTFMMVFSFYTLTIVALYQTSLITFLSSPSSGKQYETLEEALDDGVVAGLFSGIEYNTSNHDFWNKVYQPGRYKNITDYSGTLEIIHYNKSMFVRGSNVNLKFRANEFFLKKGERMMYQKMQDLSDVYFVAMYTSIGHPLLPVLRDYIMRLVESGLVEFWQDELLMERKKIKSKGKKPFPLAWVHLKGVFLMGGVMLAFAVLVFVCEVVHAKGRMGVKKKVFGVWDKNFKERQIIWPRRNQAFVKAVHRKIRF